MLFSWKPVRGADYYNLQVYRGVCCSRKLVDSHPRRARALQRLPRGRFTWYVFAHVRRGTSPSSFVLRGPQIFTVIR